MGSEVIEKFEAKTASTPASMLAAQLQTKLSDSQAVRSEGATRAWRQRCKVGRRLLLPPTSQEVADRAWLERQFRSDSIGTKVSLMQSEQFSTNIQVDGAWHDIPPREKGCGEEFRPGNKEAKAPLRGKFARAARLEQSLSLANHSCAISAAPLISASQQSITTTLYGHHTLRQTVLARSHGKHFLRMTPATALQKERNWTLSLHR